MANVQIKIFAVIFLMISGKTFLCAQTDAFGATFSFSGVSLSYQHTMTEDTFLEADLKSDLGEVFLGRSATPGASVAMTWNLILKEWTGEDGECIALSAGTGIHTGWGNDFKKDVGFNFGLKGRFGVECRYRRNFSISASIAPVLGMHMVRLEESLEMRYFMNGLLWGIMPEIGIRYIF